MNRRRKQVKIIQSKSVRLPPARMVLPVYAFADFKAPAAAFHPRDPERPANTVRTAEERRFRRPGLDRQQPPTRTIGNARPHRACRQAEETAQSSRLHLHQGRRRKPRHLLPRQAEHRKRRRTAQRSPNLAGNAANIFLQQVRWENSGEIIGKIRALEAFDIRSFGSRIQFKKEFGETPRYNFLANQISKRGPKTPGDLFFDRGEWFPLTGSDGLPMIDGMMAGESAEG